MSDFSARSASSAMRGFTLIELMITILVAAVLLGVALPEFRTTINNNRVANKSNDLVNAFNIARAEALSRGNPVSVCAANALGTGCSNSTAWNGGWIVFTDTGVAGTVDGADVVLRTWPALDAADLLVAPVAFVSFTAQGVTTAAAAQTFSLTPHVCVGKQVRSIDLNPGGRVSLRRSMC